MNTENTTKKAPKRRRLSYAKRKSLYGFGFISLWLIGTLTFFLVPMVKSLINSFSEVTLQPGAAYTEWVGLKNYAYVLNEDAYYTEYLQKTLLETLWKAPLIIIFSLFIAVILNQKFRGRALARAIFFLPVIIATGPVYKIISGDMTQTGNMEAAQFSTMFSADLVGDLMDFLGVYGRLSEFIASVTDNIFSIIWSSGIQILLFLAALQNIPSSAREAAMLEGATAWEYFWKITFPYVSPFILANLIFTVIDSFTSPMNLVMTRILDMNSELLFGRAAAMALIYFFIVLAAIGIITGAASRFIYYEND